VTEVERQELEQAPQGAGEAEVVAQEGATDAQPVAEQAEAPIAKPVDLSEVPEFRKWQAEQDRKEAQLRQQMGALQQRAQELEQQQYELATAGMDEAEKATYQARALQAQVQQQQYYIASMQQAQAMEQRVQSALQAAGLKREDVPPADYPDELAWRNAVTAEAVKRAEAKASAQAKETKRQARKSATKVDLGSSPPSGGKADQIRKQMAGLKHTGNMAQYLELRRELDALETG